MSTDTLPTRADFRFFWQTRVRYSEIDGQKVVFNAHYLTYFDCAITEFMRHLPYDYIGQVDRTGEDFHTVRSVVEYKAPARFDDVLDIGVRIGRLGRSSLTFAQAIFLADSDRLLTTGEVVWVNTDQTTGRPVSVPAELVERLTERGEV
ncbi:acyl-CoA thioesterase [Roseospirillum parvum]|uniref:Acyl-CoA thioester hydrolase n=1 Tax=Roseospirillum parvum TaxID=83401 RepID=A0A1G8CRR3_9PROT|nr:thioesterase family protein [Roseospirillum parvum]SDH48195.1 acyl-CoA thioester hydrolase [Roseospirillum parvum]